MITVKIKIWKFQELLHEGNYQFETMREATNYQLGLFNGMNLMGAEATGMELKPVETELNSLVKEILKRKKAGIDCTEAESAEIKYFVKSHIEFIEHFGVDNSNDEATVLMRRISVMFPIEMSEVIDEL